MDLICSTYEEFNQYKSEPKARLEEGEEETAERSFEAIKIKHVDEEKWEKFIGYFQKAFTAAPGPFQGDLENPDYKEILEQLRSFNPEDHPAPEKKAADQE